MQKKRGRKMKNWQIILWIFIFFPIGIYLMFKHTDWSKPIKYGITFTYALALIAGGLEVWAYLFFFSSIIIVIAGIISFFRKRNRRQSVGLLALGVILFSFTGQYINAEAEEQARIEQQEQEAQAEKERLAEEEKQREIARKEEQERIEAEKKLKEQLIEAIEKVEDEPTKTNYDKAVSLLDKLTDKDDRLITRLEKIKSTVDEYEEELKLAREAVEQAKTELNRESYNEAYKLVVTLSVPNRSLDRQLDELDKEIIKIEEEEKLAKEKEEEEKRIAAEKAEAERVAAEKAAQEQAQKQAAQQRASEPPKQQSPPVSQPKPAQPVETPPATNVENVVYIAPQSGTKYHFSPNCRGLNNANSIQEMSLSEAQSQGYDLCGWEK